MGERGRERNELGIRGGDGEEALRGFLEGEGIGGEKRGEMGLGMRGGGWCP